MRLHGWRRWRRLMVRGRQRARRSGRQTALRTVSQICRESITDPASGAWTQERWKHRDTVQKMRLTPAKTTHYPFRTGRMGWRTLTEDLVRRAQVHGNAGLDGREAL